MKVWKWVDRLYRWVFRHAVAIGILAIIVLAIGNLAILNTPTAPIRAKVSRMLSDFRTVKQQLAAAEQSTSSTELAVPIDVFSDPPAAAKLAVTSGTLIIFSVGPDKRSDGGRIFYEPTNGTTSQGDVITTLAENLNYSVL